MPCTAARDVTKAVATSRNSARKARLYTSGASAPGVEFGFAVILDFAQRWVRSLPNGLPVPCSKPILHRGISATAFVARDLQLEVEARSAGVSTGVTWQSRGGTVATR